jgi:membrane-bound ClpP family serine protease
MTLIILLFSLGIVFIAVEVLIPGGILGTIGALMMFGGCVAAFLTLGTASGMVAVAVAFAVAAAAFYIQFRILPKTALGRRAFLSNEITAVTSNLAEETRDLIGKSGQAVTMLSPSGYILIDGKRYLAYCQSGQVPAGAVLDVIAADNFRLIVTETTTT